ncbi:hypothetical protein GGR57DRAFT_77228 [Xylariaceae sp. FL1272]|nr:hypothetical protein GGR57DRAFT_77228 [Xylariaceae sp. FL1272]
MLPGGDICFPQLAMRLPYQPGDCVMFRGRELEHFVSDWTGQRKFLLYTNHQPVRNYAFRKMGRLSPKPNDPWHPDQVKAEEQGHYIPTAPLSEPDLDQYDPCFTEPMSPNPEKLYMADVHGAGYLSQRKMMGLDSEDMSTSLGETVAGTPSIENGSTESLRDDST